LSVIEKLICEEDCSVFTAMTAVDRFRNSIDTPKVTPKVTAHYSDEVWIKNHFGCVTRPGWLVMTVNLEVIISILSFALQNILTEAES